jgi:hypothetical protein
MLPKHVRYQAALRPDGAAMIGADPTRAATSGRRDRTRLACETRLDPRIRGQPGARRSAGESVVRRPAKVAAAVILASAILTACEVFPRRFDVVLPEHSREEPGTAIALPVIVLDYTGLVAGLEAGPPARGRSLAIHQHPTQPTALIVDFPGGVCERDAVLELRRAEAGYRLTLRMNLDKPCSGSPANRELRLIFAKPVDPSEIEFVPEGGLTDPPTPTERSQGLAPVVTGAADPVSMS